MKMIRGLLLFGLCGLHLFFILPGSGHAGETIRLTNGEWPPYLSEHLEHRGVASRVVTEAFKEAGISVIYGFFIWKRSLDQSRAGRWDGSVVWRRTPEREKHFWFSDPVMSETTVFFHLNTRAFDWKSMDDLKGIPIGTTIGYDYGDKFRAAEKDGMLLVEYTEKDELNFRKLLKRKIDLFPNDFLPGYATLCRNFSPSQIQRITHHSRPLKSGPLHLILSKRLEGNQGIMERFNAGLARLKADGRHAKILEQAAHFLESCGNVRPSPVKPVED